MPECLIVDKELLYDINSKRLEERGCIHGRNRFIIRGYSLHILQCMDAHIIVQPETTTFYIKHIYLIYRSPYIIKPTITLPTSQTFNPKRLQMAKRSNKGLKNIGERIRYIRGPLTRPEFGKKISAYRNTVLNWESNRATPLCESLLQMHNKFNVDINWLLTGKGEPYLREIDNTVLKMETRLSALEKKVAKLAKRKMT